MRERGRERERKRERQRRKYKGWEKGKGGEGKDDNKKVVRDRREREVKGESTKSGREKRVLEGRMTRKRW